MSGGRELEEVAPGVLVATSRVMSTTSTVLVGGRDALLVDPAWLPDELDRLATALHRRGLRVIGGFATHAHHDHLLWHPRFGRAPRWASAATARTAAARRRELVDALDPGFPPDLVELMGRVAPLVDRIPEESAPPGVEIELLVHDGHAPGHTALWPPGPRVLIAGDMLSDIELPLPFDPDDLPAYLAGLDLLVDAAAQASLVIPGHGSVGRDARARLDADRRYLDDMMRRGDSADPRVRNPGMDAEHAHLKRLVSHPG
ncbi:MBL fold metallo-hydrolase [Microbacterium hominis]|uniref:MBL fold metallo-hydrolase n=1 Tax=Microbacterium hominis TaxID=162426 RepID=UPI0020B72F71|nr:MBL fold metallo-hydrolase [Microbacterium hominis]